MKLSSKYTNKLNFESGKYFPKKFDKIFEIF